DFHADQPPRPVWLRCYSQTQFESSSSISPVPRLTVCADTVTIRGASSPSSGDRLCEMREVLCKVGAPQSRMCFRRTRALALWLAFRGLCLAGIGVLGLTGCSSIKGFLVPVPSDYDAPGTTHVEMVVATTRTRAASSAVMF